MSNNGVESQTEWIIGPDQCSFFTKRWRPSLSTTPKVKVIFVHGFMEHISRYDHVFRKHAQAGIEVFGFDQRGFGQTASLTKTQGQSSWREGLEDLDFFIQHETHPDQVDQQKVFLMGHSMGGGLTFAYATSNPPRPTLSLITGGIILSSPLILQPPQLAPSISIIKLGACLGAWFPKLPLKVGVSPKDICRDPIVQEEYAHDPLCPPMATFKGVSDMILGGQKLLKEDYKRFPIEKSILAVHGSGDKVTSHDATSELITKTKSNDKTFKTFEGYYHEMHNEPGDDKWKEIGYIIDWIHQRSKL